jgi:hypothetical protein
VRIGLRRELLLLIAIFLLILVPSVRAFTFEPQVGAWGDDASRGNKGVSVEIRTHIYNTNSGDFQYFWVGDNLNNGAFIQFGYIYEPGYYCLSGQWVGGKFTCLGDSANIEGSDARWEWQYWPNANANDFSYETGSANSAGLDGTWHKYSIEPNTRGGWSFVLDDREVSYVTDAWTRSKDAAYFVAEKGGDTYATLGQLGPVEFRNLAYLKDDGWHYATALYARVGCAVNTNCDISIPYGVMSEGAGVVIAGSGIQRPSDLGLLWTGVAGGVTLTLDMPNQVTARIDDQFMQSGYSELSLSRGSHTIVVPQDVAIDSNNRLRFDHWSDGSGSSNRTFTLDSDTTLKAIYVMQHWLTIDSVVPLNGSEWYDEGSTESFSEPASIPIHADLGILGGQWAFDGWYEDGAYLTSSTSSSIVMDRPHTLQLHWHQDYAIPFAIVAILALVALVTALMVKRRRGESE